jgi:hypothetical protein
MNDWLEGCPPHGSGSRLATYREHLPKRWCCVLKQMWKLRPIQGSDRAAGDVAGQLRRQFVIYHEQAKVC